MWKEIFVAYGQACMAFHVQHHRCSKTNKRLVDKCDLSLADALNSIYVCIFIEEKTPPKTIFIVI